MPLFDFLNAHFFWNGSQAIPQGGMLRLPKRKKKMHLAKKTFSHEKTHFLKENYCKKDFFGEINVK